MQIPVQFFIGFILSSVIVYLLGFLDMLHREILVPVIFFGIVVFRGAGALTLFFTTAPGQVSSLVLVVNNMPS